MIPPRFSVSFLVLAPTNMGDLAAAWAAQLPSDDHTMPFLAFWQATRALEIFGLSPLSRASLPEWLADSAAPGVLSRQGPAEHKRYTFHHFMEYALKPLGEHLAATAGVSQDPLPWSAKETAALALIESELEGVIVGVKEHLAFDAWSSFLRASCAE